MSLGLIGRKVGMTRLFTDEGEAIPVTVIDVSDNRVAQIKTQATDGYDAIQLAHGTRRATRVTKAMAGHFAKAGVMAGNALNEFPLDAAKIAEMTTGQVIPADTAFAAGQKVDVQGVTIGKGYAVLSSAITSLQVALHTVTHVHITCQVLSVWRKIQAVFFQVSA